MESQEDHVSFTWQPIPTAAPLFAALEILPAAITSDETFGIASFLETLTSIGIGSSEAFTTPGLLTWIDSTSVQSSEVFNVPDIVLNLDVSSIISGESLGSPNLGFYIDSASISTGQAFGVSGVVFYIGATTIDDGGLFGTGEIVGGQAPIPIDSISYVGIEMRDSYSDILTVEFVNPVIRHISRVSLQDHGEVHVQDLDATVELKEE